MERDEVKNLVRSILRKDLMAEALNIVENLNEDELTKFDKIVAKYNGDSQGNIICIELDFLKTKLEYFGRIEKYESELGIDLEFMPDLVEKWRQQNDYK